MVRIDLGLYHTVIGIIISVSVVVIIITIIAVSLFYAVLLPRLVL